MRFYFLLMMKDDQDRKARTTDESSVAGGPVRSWDLMYFAFYPVGQALGTKQAEPEIERQKNEDKEQVWN